MHLESLWAVVPPVVHLDVVKRYFVKDFGMRFGYVCRLFGILPHLMKGMLLSQFAIGSLGLRSANSMLRVLLG